MKRILLLLSFAAMLMMSGCGKNSGASYYVKYEVTVSSIHGGTLDIGVNTDEGVQSFHTQSKTFSETFGPVSKGFSASVTAHTNYTVTGGINSCIYVCRGEEPFVLKATGSSSANYVINF